MVNENVGFSRFVFKPPHSAPIFILIGAYYIWPMAFTRNQRAVFSCLGSWLLAPSVPSTLRTNCAMRVGIVKATKTTRTPKCLRGSIGSVLVLPRFYSYYGSDVMIRRVAAEMLSQVNTLLLEYVHLVLPCIALHGSICQSFHTHPR